MMRERAGGVPMGMEPLHAKRISKYVSSLNIRCKTAQWVLLSTVRETNSQVVKYMQNS